MKLNLSESEVVEFKESLSELEAGGETLCGFANQSGGELYLGVKNNGEIIGIQTITEKTIRDVSQFLFENLHPQKIFSITKDTMQGLEILKVVIDKSPTPYHTFKGKPYIRIGASTRPMPQEEYQHRLITYKSTNKDYTSTTIPGTDLRELSQIAITELRKLLIQSGRYDVNIEALSDEQLLKDLLLIQNGNLTLAAVILLGTEETVSKYLPYVEVRYGYKIHEGDLRNQDTVIFKAGYLHYYNKIWEKINARNLLLTIPLGMRLIERKAFDEQTIREAVNNAVVHRDYLLSETTFVMQYQTRVTIKSPGSLPEGVTVENIIYETKPRNKLLADILFKCELVEQFGNGVNLMYKNQLSLGKNPPDYSKTNEKHVILSLDGMIQDVEFAKYVLRIADGKNKLLNDEELIILNNIRKNRTVKMNEITEGLLNLGLIERVSLTKFILSKQYYTDTNQRAKYTKRKGLSKNHHKEMILQHLRNFGAGKKSDFAEIVNYELNGKQIYRLLEELKKDGKIYFEGVERSQTGVWRLKTRGQV